MSAVRVAVVSMRPTVAMARATVAHARAAMPTAELLVLDVDGSYRQLGAETVLTPDQVGLTDARLHRMAAALSPRALEHALYPALLRAIASQHDDGQTMLAVRPGVVLLTAPVAMLEAARAEGVCVVARTPGPLPDDGRWPGDADIVRAGAYTPSLLALHGGSDLLTLWETPAASTDDPHESWLDLAVERMPHGVLREPADLLTAWNLSAASTVTVTTTAGGGLRLNGQDVVAVDLSRLDPAHPWLLEAAADGNPRGRLSEHPALAALVARYAAGLLGDTAPDAPRGEGDWDTATTSLGIEVDAPLRELFGSLRDDDPAPDPFDPAAADALRTWLTTPAPRGSPGRYLVAIHRSRPDLRSTFPEVPGADGAAFLAWAHTYALSDGYPAALVVPALARTSGKGHRARTTRPRTSAPAGRARLPRGVNVVGYLRGELGIGESARLMVSALQAAGVPHSSFPVDQSLLSRQRPDDADAPPDRQVFDTSLLCVNADLTPALAVSMPGPLAQAYRIGMWYWEVEDFPARQLGGFEHVDEVWVATEFIRTAIEPHSPVPVCTVTPPLPQRGPAPAFSRSELGLPIDGFVFLFSFDFLSTAERKNPVGLIDAFTAAFAPGEGPALVIKSINANRRPAEAERLRLRAADEPDVVLMEDYLGAAERDALMALCDCYVSLHRSEGLGLTMAEAMAWGKPVIATGYSGNLQFMTADNSFLVPWQPTAIPSDAEPYPAGGRWADPDLDAAARLMRLVVDEPGIAADRGTRAAADIASLHSPEVAGRAIATRLAEKAPRRRVGARETIVSLVRSATRRVLG